MALNQRSAPIDDGSGRHPSSSHGCTEGERPQRAAPRVVWLRGEQDRSTSDGLVAMLVEVVALDDTDLVVDLHDVTFMGASTVGVLVELGAALREHGRVLTLRAPSRVAWRVLQICGLHELIEVPAGASPLLVSKES